MVAVCRMLPQVAPLGQSPAAAYLPSSTGQAHKAWSLTNQAGIHREITQCQWPACDHPPVQRVG